MKKAVTAFLLLTTCGLAGAQDIIVKQDASEIQVKVEDVNAEGVKYHRYSNPDGPLYTISSSDVFMIKYENGDKLIMADYLKEQAVFTKNQREDNYAQIEEETRKVRSANVHDRHLEITPNARISVIYGNNRKSLVGAGWQWGAFLTADYFFNLKKIAGVSIGMGYAQSSIKVIDVSGVKNVITRQLCIDPKFAVVNHNASKWGLAGRAGFVFAIPLGASYGEDSLKDMMQLAFGIGADFGVSYSHLTASLFYHQYFKGMIKSDSTSNYAQFGLALGYRF